MHSILWFVDDSILFFIIHSSYLQSSHRLIIVIICLSFLTLRNNGRQFTSMNRCPKKMCTGVPRDARRTIMCAIGYTPSYDGCAPDRNGIYASFLTVCGSKRACTPTVPLGSWVINACTIAMRMLRNSYRTRDAY